MQYTNRNRLSYWISVSLFAALTVLSSWLAIPISPPITLQLFAVAISSYMLGMGGTLSVLIYISLGAIGLPVFAGFGGGVGHLFGASGGYIFGLLVFSLAVAVPEKLLGSSGIKRVLFSLIGLVLLYLIGSVWYTLVYIEPSFSAYLSSLLITVLPYILPDILKLFLAMGIANRLSGAVKLK